MSNDLDSITTRAVIESIKTSLSKELAESVVGDTDIISKIKNVCDSCFFPLGSHANSINVSTSEEDPTMLNVNITFQLPRPYNPNVFVITKPNCLSYFGDSPEPWLVEDKFPHPSLGSLHKIDLVIKLDEL